MPRSKPTEIKIASTYFKVLKPRSKTPILLSPKTGKPLSKAYQARLLSGLKRGLTFSQSSGHAAPLELPAKLKKVVEASPQKFPKIGRAKNIGNPELFKRVTRDTIKNKNLEKLSAETEDDFINASKKKHADQFKLNLAQSGDKILGLTRLDESEDDIPSFELMVGRKGRIRIFSVNDNRFLPKSFKNDETAIQFLDDNYDDYTIIE